jgi:hypothetical protein
VAIGDYSHAEGQGTYAIGSYSHSEGNQTTASGQASHSGGFNSSAMGDYSFVHGSNSVALSANTIVFGNNITGNTSNTVYVPYFNIGNLGTGTSVNNLGVDSSGNVVVGTSGGTSGGGIVWSTLTNADAQSQILSTANVGILHKKDNVATVDFTLPTVGLNIGDVIEIVEDKPTSVGTQTRINAPIGGVIDYSNQGPTTVSGYVESQAGFNSVWKLMYVGSNKWRITRYEAYDGTVVYYPPQFN